MNKLRSNLKTVNIIEPSVSKAGGDVIGQIRRPFFGRITPGAETYVPNFASMRNNGSGEIFRSLVTGFIVFPVKAHPSVRTQKNKATSSTV